MEPSELLRHCVTVLDGLRVSYFVTGSVATVYYGEPRFTNDIDVVVDLPAQRVTQLCRAFPPPEFYVSEDAAREAVEHHGQFNIIHPASGLKVDMMVPADTAFNRSRFARVQRVKPSGDYEACFAAAEDVIIKKLEYYREGGSEKHLRDIAGVLKISGERVDRAYIAGWASRLGLEDIWRAVQDRVGPL
jgi:hypothetical protein